MGWLPPQLSLYVFAYLRDLFSYVFVPEFVEPPASSIPNAGFCTEYTVHMTSCFWHFSSKLEFIFVNYSNCFISCGLLQPACRNSECRSPNERTQISKNTSTYLEHQKRCRDIINIGKYKRNVCHAPYLAPYLVANV